MDDQHYDWLEYEEEDDVGPVGPRTLLDFCQGVVMRCASRYDNVGSLRYHQHPLFFQTMNPVQLARIEENSPELRAETNDVWKEILKKKDPATYTKHQTRFKDDRKVSSKTPEPRWRKVYLRVLEKERIRQANAVEHMKMMYAEEASKRSNRTVKIVENPTSMGATQRKGPKTLMGKIKEQARAEKGMSFQPTGHVLRRPTDELSLRIVNKPASDTAVKKSTLKPIVTRPPPPKSTSVASNSSSGIIYASPSSSSRDTQDKTPIQALDFFASGGESTTQRKPVIIRKQVMMSKPNGSSTPSPGDKPSVPVTPIKRPLSATQVIDVDNYESKAPSLTPPPAAIPRARSSSSAGGLFVPRKKSKYR